MSFRVFNLSDSMRKPKDDEQESQSAVFRDVRNKEPVQNTQLLANVFFTLLGDRLRNSAMTGHFIVTLYKTHYHPLYLTVSAAIHVTT